MPRPGRLGGPGLPGRTRITTAEIESHAVMEQNSMGRFIKEAERSGDMLMERLADSMEGKAKRFAPVRTGKLRDSIVGRVLNNGREASLWTDVPYAGVMEEGSKPHRIHGVRATFMYKKGTREFVPANFRYGPVGSGKRYENWTVRHGATVKHPGTKPYKFFQRAYEATWIEARMTMREVYRA